MTFGISSNSWRKVSDIGNKYISEYWIDVIHLVVSNRYKLSDENLAVSGGFGGGAISQ